MATERDKLQQAHTLIKQRQFDAARLILLEIPDHPTAQKWLAKLEEIAPTGTGPVSPTAPDSTPPVTNSSPIRPLSEAAPTTGGWDHNPAAAPPVIPPAEAPPQPGTINLTIDIHLARYATAAIAGVAGLLMIASFFLAPWMDLSQINFFGFDLGAMGDGFDVDQGPLEITAMELFMGRNDGEPFVVDIENPEGDFTDVRLIDRLLILIPVGGLVLIWLAWMYASGEMQRLTAAGALALVALLLLLAPFAWETLSDDQLEGSLENSMEFEGDTGEFDFDFGFFGDFMNIYSQTYSTGEQQILGIVAFLAGLAAFGIEAYGEVNAQPHPRRPAA